LQVRGLEWKRRGGQEAHRSSARHGFPCCESGFSQRVAVVSSVVKNGLLKLLAFFALTVLTIKTTLDTTKSWCSSLQFVPSVLLPPRIGHACCPYYIFSQPHAQFQTVGVNAACLPMSSHLMLRKLSIFFSSAGLLRPGGRAATASFTFDTGRAVTHGLQLELKKAVATRIRVWASN